MTTKLNKYKLQARIWTFVVFLVLTAAHYCFYRFSIDPRNPYPLTRGAAFGCVLWSTVLLIAVWLRHAWARYLLIAFICVAVAGFGLVAVLTGKEVVDVKSVQMVISGTMFYAIGAVLLWIPRSLNHYLAPRTAGE